MHGTSNQYTKTIPFTKCIRMTPDAITQAPDPVEAGRGGVHSSGWEVLYLRRDIGSKEDMTLLQVLLIRTTLEVLLEGVSTLEMRRRDGGFIDVGVNHCGGLEGMRSIR